MKKLTFLTVLVLLLSSAVIAQVGKGTIVVGGSSGLSVVSTTAKEYYDGQNMSGDGYKSTIVSFKPYVGYFIFNQFSIRLGASIESSKPKDGDASTVYAIMAELMYHVPVAGNVKPFISGSVGYAGAKNQYGIINVKDQFNGLGYGGSAGVNIFLRDNISLDLGFQYLGTDLKNVDDTKYHLKTSNFGGGLGFSLYFF